MHIRLTGLWRSPDFVKLWSGQTVSLVGSEITYLALPLTAVTLLHATPVQMGLLRMTQFAPVLLFGLLAGLWVDHLRRRPLMIATDLGRTAVLAIVPGAALLGHLQLPLLYAVSFLTGALGLLFDVACQAFVPALIGREALTEGNSKLEVSRTTAQIAGPGLTGLLLQVVSAPTTLVLDALSFLVSALSLTLIRKTEPVPAARPAGHSLRLDVAEGLRFLWAQRTLRALIGFAATYNLFNSIMTTLLILYMSRELGLAPGAIGLVLVAAEVGSLLGALSAGPAARRWGPGRALVMAPAVAAIGVWLVPFAGGRSTVAAIVLSAGLLIKLLGIGIYSINQVTFRQALTPDRLQGRVGAGVRVLTWATIPLGALLGGALGDAFGLRTAMAVAAAGTTLGLLWLTASPLRAVSSGLTTVAVKD